MSSSPSSRSNGTRWLARSGLAIALVTLGTLVLRFPMPQTEGYVNVGDTFIFVLAAEFGPLLGALAGGLGSALADLLAGYPHWAPWTLVIKAVEGALAGWLLRVGAVRTPAVKAARPPLTIPRFVFACVMAGLWMVIGYSLAETLLYSWPAAIASLPGNLIQAGVSLLLALPLTVALRHLRG
ncbi:MAG: ECF transporter S component [Limnochordaceae bacterium]|nr:ECF transporter S component [Limnochordaceae bacterium]